MEYEIVITYDTGDSFHSEENVQGTIEGTWKNKEIIQENIKRIKEHNEFYIQKGRYRPPKLDFVPEQQPWFVEKYPLCLNLVLDNGKEYQYSPFWIGYFETLREIQVKLKTTSKYEDGIAIEFPW